jgi:hypothetical protein
VNHEIGEATVSDLIQLTFDTVEQKWGAGGSPYQKWYRSVATGKDAIVDNRSNEEGIFENSRLIAWKKGKPFDAENLFFRTVDTGRLLPMYLADFRMQFYAHTSFWAKLDAIDSGRKGWVYQPFHHIYVEPFIFFPCLTSFFRVAVPPDPCPPQHARHRRSRYSVHFNRLG